MLFRKIPPLAALFLTAAVLNCSDFSSSTDLGSDITNDLDPSIADPLAVLSQGTYTLDSMATTSSRDSGNIANDNLLLGALLDEFTNAYIELDTSATIAAAYSLDSVVLAMDAVQSLNFTVSPVPLSFRIDTLGLRSHSAVPIPNQGNALFAAFAATPEGATYNPVRVRADSLRWSTRQWFDSAWVIKTDSAVTAVIDTLPAPGVRTSVVTAVSTDTINSAARGSARAELGTKVLTQWRGRTADSTGTRTVCLDDSCSLTRIDTIRVFLDTLVNDTSWTEYSTSTTGKTQVFTNGQALDTLMLDSTSRERWVVTIPAGCPTQVDSTRCRQIVDTLVADTTRQRSASSTRFVRTELAIRGDTSVTASVSFDTVATTSLVTTTTIRDSAWHDSSVSIVRLRDTDIRYRRTTDFPVSRLELKPATRALWIRPSQLPMPGVARFSKPYLNVYYKKSALDSVSVSTRVEVRYFDYHLYESATSHRNVRAITSEAARRNAVVRFDARGLMGAIGQAAAGRGMRTVLTATALLPAVAVAEEARTDLLLRYYLTSDTTEPPIFWRPSKFDADSGLLKLDLRMPLDSFWSHPGSIGPDSTLYLHLRLQTTREMRTVELLPASSLRQIRFEFALTNPAIDQ